MRHSLYATAALAALLLSSCSDDPVTPGDPIKQAPYQTSVDFYTSTVRSLWGSASGQLFVSGTSIMRYDGREWEPMQLPELDRGLFWTWGTSNGDVYSIGQGSINRFDGVRWNGIPRPRQVRDVWGADNGEIFVLGDDRLYHYDGADWTIDSLHVSQWGDPWRMISGGSPDDVYIAGWDGWIGHFDGNTWSASRPDSLKNFNSIWKAPDGPLYMATYDTLFTYQNDRLAHVDPRANVWSIGVCGRSANDVFCFGDSYYPNNTVLRYDGTDWSHVGDVPGLVQAVWRDPASGRVFAGGDHSVWEIEDGEATLTLGTGERFDSQRFFDMWGSENGNIYLVGNRAYRYRDGVWTDLKKHELTESAAYSIWGRSEKEIYAVGPGWILHYDGRTWIAVAGGADVHLNAVSGNDHEVFAVGYPGVILRHDGISWSRMESGTTYELFAVYAWDQGAFAGGEDGALIRYDGSTWRPFPSPVSWNIYDMLGLGPNSIYAVGASSTEICHFDGRAWQPVEIGFTGASNVSIWGTSERLLMLGQSNGSVFRFDGSQWMHLPRVMSSPVRAVWGTQGEVIAAMETGVVRFNR